MESIHENRASDNAIIAPYDTGEPSRFNCQPLVKPNLSEALTLAKAGVRVFPLYPIKNDASEDRKVCTCKRGKNCKATGKHPRIKGWVEKASSDPRQVSARWSCSQPGSEIGIGLVMGGDFFCLDVDGPQGEESLAKLTAKHGPLPETLEASTGRKDKGRHLLFRKPPDRKVVTRRYDNALDVKGEGSFVVAAPTLHKSGARYSWTKIVRIAPAPDWLLSELDSPVRQNKPNMVNGSEGAGITPRLEEPRKRPSYLSSASDHKIFASAKSGIFGPLFPEWDAAIEADLDNLLAHIDGETRENWLGVGMVLAHWTVVNPGLGEILRKKFDKWSKRWPEKFNEADQESQWRDWVSRVPERKANGEPLKNFGTLVLMAGGRARQEPLNGASQAVILVVTGAEPLTDLGNARRLVHRHGADLRYIHAWRKWMVWDDGRWHTDDTGDIERRAKETIEAMHDGARNVRDEEERTKLRKHALKCQAEARLNAMTRLAESEPEVVLSPQELDADPWILGVRNGVIDLRTGTFRPARREDYITHCAGVSYGTGADCPHWKKFLDTIMGGNSELVAYLQRVTGYLLTGLVKEEVLFVLWGTGRNGKSTFRETIHALLGSYAISADAGLLVQRQVAGAATPDVARLKGRRLVAINETDQKDQLNEARVKFLTSNDKITARHLYAEPFDFSPTHKTILTTNHKPVVRGTDEGIWRRIHLVPFTVVIPESEVERDFRENRLIPELPGILNWALEGLSAYLEMGLNPPEAVRSATQDYRDDMDQIGQWIEERCVLDPTSTVPTSDLHVDYQTWATKEVGFTLSAARFGRDLADRGFTCVKGTGGRRQRRGLRLRTGNEGGLAFAKN